jgi:alpha-tubulin suppressor-like RCC1 family protein
VVVRPDVVVPTDNGLCPSGATRSCYTGLLTTRGVGACRDGSQTCVAGAWGACTGQVLPAIETCGNLIDDNCSGDADEGCMPTSTGPQVSALTAGNVHACVTESSGQTSCWGGNPFGQLTSLMPAGTSRPTRAPALDGVQLASNENYLCLRRADGSVACTGNNANGQLGDGTNTNRSTPVEVTAARGATWIGAGYYHACAVVAGTVRCWGRNESRQCGVATTTLCGSNPCARPAVTVPGITDAVQVAAGLSHTCALLRDGTVRCWGDNSSGQIGNGTSGSADLGVTEVPGLRDVVQLASGNANTCAVLRDGTVRCWGGNTFGMFLDTGMQRTTPTAIPGLTGVAQLAMSVYHACARLTAGGLRCWGYNSYGQVGDGTTATPRTTLVTPVGLPPVADVAVGYWLTCARTADRAVWCWGWNLSGGVGDGTSGNTRATPVRILP